MFPEHHDAHGPDASRGAHGLPAKVSLPEITTSDSLQGQFHNPIKFCEWYKVFKFKFCIRHRVVSLISDGKPCNHKAEGAPPPPHTHTPVLGVFVLFVVLLPLENILLIWKRHHWRRMASDSSSLTFEQDLYRATPGMTGPQLMRSHTIHARLEYVWFM